MIGRVMPTINLYGRDTTALIRGQPASWPLLYSISGKTFENKKLPITANPQPKVIISTPKDALCLASYLTPQIIA